MSGDLHKLRDFLDDALQSCVPPDLAALGWKYQDFNTKFSPDAWSFLLRLLGEGEYKLLVVSEGHDGEPWVRGQFLISPQGYKNLADKERRESIPWEIK